jgi:hypothetical protein
MRIFDLYSKVAELPMENIFLLIKNFFHGKFV